MMSPMTFQTVDDSRCDCCLLPFEAADSAGSLYGCAERKTIFTHREEHVLKRIRDVALQARAIRQRLQSAGSQGSTDGEQWRSGALHELDVLKKTREDLELERLAAAHERMVLLGHA